MKKLTGIYHEPSIRLSEDQPESLDLNGWMFEEGEVRHTVLYGGGHHGFVYYDRYNDLTDELEEVEEVWLGVGDKRTT